MNATTTVVIQTPDGIQRSLRWTGSVKFALGEFLHERGSTLVQEIERGDEIFYRIAWLMMRDEDGKMPTDLTFERFINTAPADSGVEVAAAVQSAISQGKVEKNELEALLRKAMAEATQPPIGENSSPFAISASGSLKPNSGMGSRSPKSKRSRTNGSATKIQPIDAPA